VSRPPLFTSEQIVDSAMRVAATSGPASATVGAIASELGAPTGSIYHRFESKETLLAEVWLRVVSNFQEGFLSALGGEGVREAGLEAALHTPRWARAHPSEAQVLLLHRREEFIAEPWPTPLKERAADLARALDRALARFAERRFGQASAANLRRVAFALVDVPYAAVHRDLRSRKKPTATVDELVRETYEALLG
jgi:AcrR family transcriptional regulator